jgi:hypothetical protein
MVYNRRVGERVLIGATQITWEPAPDDRDDAETESRSGLLMDVSVTGAGLFGPADPAHGIDDQLIVGFNNAYALVQVRRVRPVDDAELRYYGVEFVAMGAEFERTLHDAIERGQGKAST